MILSQTFPSNMNLYLDIETLPSINPELIATIEQSIQAPGQYKKPESIAEWMAANKEQVVKDHLAKTSFDGMYGRIACIAWAYGDGDIASTTSAMEEGEALECLYATIEKDFNLTVVGHNVAAFDLTFMRHRSIIHGIRPPPPMYRAMLAKPWDGAVADTMLMWSTDRDKRVSLHNLSRALGLDGKDGFDGSMVAETWPVDPQKVIDYCKADVELTRDVYRRLTFARKP